MRSKMLLRAAFVCSLTAVLAYPAGPPTALDKATLEQYVRHLFLWGPQIQINVLDPKPSKVLPGFREVVIAARNGQASLEETFYVSADGQNIIRGSVYNVAQNPFSADQAKLNTKDQPSFGPADAPVSLVVFSDFQCGYCKQEANILRKELASAYPKEVRVIFKDFPLEPIHPWAKPAAVAGRCIYRQKPAAFWEYHDWVFEKQGEITTENLKDKVTEFAKTQAIEPIQLAACLDSKATEAEVTRSQTEGHALGVNSTPTAFINGRKLVGGVPWQQLKSVIDHELEYHKTQTAGQSCCQVNLSTPAK